jgi:hypothetical protein
VEMLDLVVTHVGDVITNRTCVNRFTVTRTYRSTDVCGNSGTCSQIITVFDNTAPVVVCRNITSISWMPMAMLQLHLFSYCPVCLTIVQATPALV